MGLECILSFLVGLAFGFFFTANIILKDADAISRV